MTQFQVSTTLLKYRQLEYLRLHLIFNTASQKVTGDVPRALSSTSSYPASPFFPWSSQKLSSPSPGSAASLEKFRQEPEVEKRSLIRTETGGWDRTLWWKGDKHVVITKHPWDPGWGGRLRLFHMSSSEDGSQLSSQIQCMWSPGPQCMGKSCITGDLCSGALGDLLPGNTIPRRCPATVRIIKRNLNVLLSQVIDANSQ